jgi:trigger factor
MNRLIGQAASQYQGKDRDAFIRYLQQEPMAAAQLRAPLYEDKVVDFLFSTAKVNERKATRAEVEADLESEEGHVHGPDCGHDHASAPAKPKKASAKKAEPKPEKPAKGPVENASAKPKPAKPVKDGAGAKAPTTKAAAKPAKAEAKPAKAEAKPTKVAAKPAKAAAKPAKVAAKPAKVAAKPAKAAAKPEAKPAKAAPKPAAKKPAAKKAR